MVAKRNAEVERLNELAREVMRAEGRLGDGGDRGRGAPLRGRRPGHHPRQRPARRRSTTASAGGSRRSTSSSDAWRWTGSTPTGGWVSIPATWGGSTSTTGRRRSNTPTPRRPTRRRARRVDRAYVMADPSMDRQEFYVAASRSREETYFYATPEIESSARSSRRRSPDARGPRAHRRSGRARRRPGRRPRRGAALRLGRPVDRRADRAPRLALRPRPVPRRGASSAVNELEQRIAGNVDFLGRLDAQRERLPAMPRKLRRTRVRAHRAGRSADS